MQLLSRTWRALVLALVAMLMLSAMPGALAEMQAKSASGATKTVYAKEACCVYKSMKTSSKKLVKLAAGDDLTLIKKNSKWAKVTASGKTGFIPVSKLASEKPGASEAYQTLQPGDKGDAVKKLQTRLKALNWFNGDIGGNYLTLTTQAVTDFQEAAKLAPNGIADEQTQKALYASGAPRFEITGLSTCKPASGAVREMDWWSSEISTIFARNSYAVVTDVRTGISFKVYRSGGTNHADVQPATAKDTAAMKAAYGGNWSWDRRAIWVSIGGKRYAASMNGMPHGSGSISGNDFGGHFCIHFTNSRTHGTNKLCPLHQAAIQIALAAA